jgi:hypothetical protein
MPQHEWQTCEGRISPNLPMKGLCHVYVELSCAKALAAFLSTARAFLLHKHPITSYQIPSRTLLSARDRHTGVSVLRSWILHNSL